MSDDEKPKTLPRADPAKIASEQARYTYWCQRLGRHENRDDGEPCRACAGFVGNQDEPVTDWFLIAAHFHSREFCLTCDLEEAIRQRDEAIEERDHARSQLQAIGRKSFWAARAGKPSE